MDQANQLRRLMETNKVVMPASSQTPKTYQFNSRLITVTSGKGGVGKSNFTLNLAIQLSQTGKKVIVIDADFGMANIEVLIGVMPKRNMLHVLKGECTIHEAIAEGPHGLSFISGGSGFTDLAALTEQQVEFLIETFTYLDENFDFILIDTGAGASHQVVNMVRASKETIIVTTPEPTALTDAYAMIKILKSVEPKPEMFIVINRTESRTEGEEIYLKLNRVSQRFLGLELKLLGYIPDDPNLAKAVKKQQPMTSLFPKSPASKSIIEISKEIGRNETLLLTQDTSAKGFLTRFTGMFKK